MTKRGSQESACPSQLIDAQIKELGDWRGELLSRLRALVKGADPESSKSGSGEGFRCGRTTESSARAGTYRNAVKMPFAKGAALKDPSGLFNSSLEGHTRRAIDFHEGEKINEKALKTLVRGAVALNESKTKR